MVFRCFFYDKLYLSFILKPSLSLSLLKKKFIFYTHLRAFFFSFLWKREDRREKNISARKEAGIGCLLYVPGPRVICKWTWDRTCNLGLVPWPASSLQLLAWHSNQLSHLARTIVIAVLKFSNNNYKISHLRSKISFSYTLNTYTCLFRRKQFHLFSSSVL